MAAGMIGLQVGIGSAEPECTCEIVVHGSNCPLSRCTCGAAEAQRAHSDDVTHAEGCALYGLSADLTQCSCTADVHAEGCPRYQGNAGVALAMSVASDDDDVSDEPGAEAEAEAAPADESATASDAAYVPEETAAPIDDESDAQAEPSSDPAEAAADESEQQPEESSDSADEVEEPIGEVIIPETEEENDEWEYPSGWDGYGTGWMDGNVLAAVSAFRMETLLDEHVLEVGELLGRRGDIKISDTTDRFPDILAVYAVLTGQTDSYPYDVAIDPDEFASVYWSMTQVTGVSNKNGAVIHIERLSAAEASEQYHFTDAQRAALAKLADRASIVQELVDKSIFSRLSEEELASLYAAVPEDLSPSRRAVLLTALALNGKVSYFWGGKSVAYGWDDRWGEMRTVSSEGSSTYGTGRPLGLDCSGFVSWTFANAFRTENEVGTCSVGPWKDAYAIAWEDARPGDIVYYYVQDSTVNHVGIVVDVNENGPVTVMQCGSRGTLLVSADGFHYAYRPYIYGD